MSDGEEDMVAKVPKVAPKVVVVPQRGGTVAEGAYVVIEGGQSHVVARIVPGAHAKLGRLGSVALDSLLGMPYDIAIEYDAETKSLVRWDGNPDADEAIVPTAPTDDGGHDNRNLADTSDAQTFKQSDIRAMKETGGVDGIVQKLVDSSTTFQQKTAFSKDKYVRKKAAKWVHTFKLRRVGLPDLCREGAQSHTKIFLRFDSLALLMNHANVDAGAQVLLYDESNGVLPAALLTRILPGDGCLLHVVAPSQQPRTHAVNQLGLDNRSGSWLAVAMEHLTGSERSQNAKDPRWVWHAPGPLAVGRATSMVIAVEWNVKDIFDLLFPYLSLSGTFAVFCPVLTPLQDLFFKLRVDRAVVNCNVMDVWTREYQVLPMRTHPVVVLPAMGGYLLTGTKSMWHPLCYQFHETSVLGVYDVIAGRDGLSFEGRVRDPPRPSPVIPFTSLPFLAMSRRQRRIPTEPMWVLMGRRRPTSLREALLVDVDNDEGLLRMVSAVASMTNAHDIARYVSCEMGGPNVTESMCVFPHGQFVVRLGEVSVGVCRHRSLLLKVLCDVRGVPCGLVRGTYNGVPHQWNVIPGDWILDPTATDLEPILPSGEEGRRKMKVLVGITGSVAALKVRPLVEALLASGASVRVVATNHGLHFVPPGDREYLTGTLGVEFFTDAEEWAAWGGRGDPVCHIDLRAWADVFVIAPLDANTLAKLAHGLCDNLLTCVARAWPVGGAKRMIAAPAMNTFMWDHPLTGPQITTLRDVLRVEIVSPVVKVLMCGEIGNGAMASVEEIVAVVLQT